MIEETSGAEAPSQTQPSPPEPVSTVLSTDLTPVLARIEALEAQGKTLLESIAPRLQAFEEAVVLLAKRAESILPNSVVSELSELKTVVASLGGGITGAPGHDAAAFFHAWWAKITGQADSARSHETATANSGPLAAGGAPIPLSPSTKQ